jgi:hypothetical protein
MPTVTIHNRRDHVDHPIGRVGLATQADAGGRVEGSRRQLVPYFSTIPILNISTKVSSQTKILERGTKEEIRISKEALFKGVSTRFGPFSIAKCFLRNPDFLFCSSFQNLRLGAETRQTISTGRSGS